jgi:hypothetical protein
VRVRVAPLVQAKRTRRRAGGDTRAEQHSAHESVLDHHHAPPATRAHEVVDDTFGYAVFADRDEIRDAAHVPADLARILDLNRCVVCFDLMCGCVCVCDKGADRLYYAELLYRWTMFEQRLELLGVQCDRHTTTRALVEHKVPTNAPSAHSATVDSSSSGSSARELARCSVCRNVVRHLALFCVACAHGGHERHVRAWFAVSGRVCPTPACACECASNFAADPTLTVKATA